MLDAKDFTKKAHEVCLDALIKQFSSTWVSEHNSLRELRAQEAAQTNSLASEQARLEEMRKAEAQEEEKKKAEDEARKEAEKRGEKVAPPPSSTMTIVERVRESKRLFPDDGVKQREWLSTHFEDANAQFAGDTVAPKKPSQIQAQHVQNLQTSLNYTKGRVSAYEKSIPETEKRLLDALKEFVETYKYSRDDMFKKFSCFEQIAGSSTCLDAILPPPLKKEKSSQL
eukprot:g36722.t1